MAFGVGPSSTALGKLAIGTADPVDTAMNFREFDPGVRRELKDTNGTRGTFWKDSNRMLENRQVVAPKLSTEPTSAELDYLLTWAMGSVSGSTTHTYTWTNTAQTRYLYYRPVNGEDWFLSGVAVNSMTMRASSGEALSVDMDLLGQTYTDSKDNFPAITYDQTKSPFLLSHLVLNVNGTARKCREFSFGINSGLDTSRYLNSLTLTALNKLSASLPVSIDVPSGDNAGIWKLGVTGTAFSAVFTNPVTGSVLTITLPTIRFPAQTPQHPFGGEGFVRVEGEAVRTTTDDPMTITLLL